MSTNGICSAIEDLKSVTVSLEYCVLVFICDPDILQAELCEPDDASLDRVVLTDEVTGYVTHAIWSKESKLRIGINGLVQDRGNLTAVCYCSLALPSNFRVGPLEMWL